MAISKPKGANYTTGRLFDVQLALFIIQDTKFQGFSCLIFTQLSKSRGWKNESGTWQASKGASYSERVSGSGFSGVKTRFPDVRWPQILLDEFPKMGKVSANGKGCA